MSTENPNVNDLKIRLLQLKGLGYDKLLNRDTLQNQLDTINNELVAIAGELEALTKVILEVEGVPEGGGVGPTIQHPVEPPPTQPVTSQNNKLPPAPKTNTPPKTKAKKTSHKIGRRT